MRGRRDPHDDPASARPRSSPPPVPTLGQLLHQPYWLWLRCDACDHRVAVALAPFVIRWGADASSDVLRTQTRFTVCGRHDGEPSRGCGYRDSPSASRPASVIRTRATSIILSPALTFSCAIVASPRLTSPAIVETLKPCAASNGPVTPLRPAPASKLTARRRSALRRIVGTGRMRRVRRRLRWRDGAGGFLPGLCTAGSQSSRDKRPWSGEGS
jgi:hypothetical protein